MVRDPGRLRRLATAVGLALAMVAVSANVVGSAGASPLTDKQAEASQIAAKLNDLQVQQMQLSAQYEQANYKLSQAQDQVHQAQALLDQTNAELDRQRAQLRSFAVEAYQTGNDSPTIDALLTSTPDQGVAKTSYLESQVGNRQDLLDALNAVQRKADDDTKRLQQAQAEAQRYSDQIAQAKSAADTATAQTQALNNQVQGELATLVHQEQARLAAEAQAKAAAQFAAQQAQAPAPTPAPTRAPAPNTGNTGGNNNATPAPTTNPAPPPTSSGKAAGAIAAGMKKLNAPYVWGAAGPNSFDCSGFVAWAYAQVGVMLPHYSGAQYASTTRISASQLQPGDLVFWGPGGSEHVAIYIGGGQLLHTFSAPTGVAVTALQGWWKPPTGYGRINF